MFEFLKNFFRIPSKGISHPEVPDYSRFNRRINRFQQRLERRIQEYDLSQRTWSQSTTTHTELNEDQARQFQAEMVEELNDISNRLINHFQLTSTLQQPVEQPVEQPVKKQEEPKPVMLEPISRTRKISLK